jgi:hypothetical protein
METKVKIDTKWPVITKKQAEELLTKQADGYESRCSYYQKQLFDKERRHEREIAEKVNPMCAKFFDLLIKDDPSRFKRYALQFSIDTSWVENCFIHGNSQSEISYLAHHIGRMVEDEVEILLKRRNFVRTA